MSKVFKISPTLWFDDILCEINYSLINFDMKSLFNCFRHLWNHRMRFYLFTLRIRESGFAGELWAGISNTACPHTKCVWVVTFLNYEMLPNHKYNIFWKNPRKIIVLLKMDQKTNLKWIPSQICHIFGLLNMWENPKKKIQIQSCNICL